MSYSALIMLHFSLQRLQYVAPPSALDKGLTCSLFYPIQEMFIRYLAEQGHNVVKSERKPRKTIQYKDLGW